MAERGNIVIGGFQILRRLEGAVGGEGFVCEAKCVEDVHHIVPPGEIVALKIMMVQDDDGVKWRRLKKRTEELKRLSHPNIVRYYGCFEGPQENFSQAYVVVQEFLDGESLKQRLDKVRILDTDTAIGIIRLVVSGLEYASRNGIVHRDVKPGNVMLCRGGGVKLVDFELAKQVDGSTTGSSVSGAIKGTYDYMAPDFTVGNFHGDETSDVFSMGVVIHEMTMGRLPYHKVSGTADLMTFFSRWREGNDPINISRRLGYLYDGLADVVKKALARSRADRYQDFVQLSQALSRVHVKAIASSNRSDTYELLYIVGQGGFGRVFRARSTRVGDYVAIKQLLLPSQMKSFLKEARVMQELNSPRFVRYRDFIVSESQLSGKGTAYLVMDYLEKMPGSSLRDAINRSHAGHAKWREVFISFERYALALHEMHGRGLVHRDIKPSNLYFRADKPEAAVIMDLGIVRDKENPSTAGGQVPGTYDYMPPEVVYKGSVSTSRGEAQMDIYALGLCLYEALSGGKRGYPRLSADAKGFMTLVDRARMLKAPTFDDEAVSADAEILDILRNMTNPRFEQRIGRVADVVRILRRLLRTRYGYEGKDWQEALEPAPSSLSPKPASSSVRAAPPPKPPVERRHHDDECEDGTEYPTQQISPSRLGQPSAPWVTISIFVGVAALAVMGMVFAWVFYFNPRYAEREADAIVALYQAGDRRAAGDRHMAWSLRWSRETSKWLFRLKPDVLSRLEARLEEASKWRPGPQPSPPPPSTDAMIVVPSLGRDVKCVVDGRERRSGETFALAVRGEPYAVEYTRGDGSVYESQTLQVVAEAGRSAILPAPGEWVPKKARVKIPQQLGKGVECRIDDMEYIGGATVWLSLDRDHKGMYVRGNERDPFELKLTAGQTQTLRAPNFKPLPPPDVEITVPRLAKDVKCVVAGRERKSGEKFTLSPRTEPYTLEYVRGDGRAYAAQTANFVVKAGSAMTLPAPKEWEANAVAVVLPAGKYPTGAACEIAGRRLPEEGVRVELSPGAYPYKWTLAGHVPQAGNVTVEPGRDAVIPAPPSPWPLMEVEVVVPRLADGTVCWVDGQRKSSGDKVRLTAGSHKCRYERTGYKPQEKTFAVSEGGGGEIPGPTLPWPKEFGRVSVPRLEKGVKCVVNDEPREPGMFELPVGKCKYRYERAGYESQRGEWEVKIGSTALPTPAANAWKPTREAETRRASMRSLLADAPVATRRERLSRAEGILESSKNAIPAEWIAGLRREIDVAKARVVGEVVNKCRFDVQVAGDVVKAGETKAMTFASSLPKDWKARRAEKGYGEKVLPTEFDGATVELHENDFAVLNVAVTVKSSVPGVACLVDGKEIAAEIQPGTYECVWRRRGYDDIAGRSFTAKIGEPCVITAPATGEWKASGVAVRLVSVVSGARCFVDGAELHDGARVMPGRKYVCTWRRPGYDDIAGRTFTPSVGEDCGVACPAVGDWKVSSVAVRLVSVVPGAKCFVDGAELHHGARVTPGRAYACTWRRAGYDDITGRSFTPSIGEDCTVACPAHGEWKASSVAVRIASRFPDAKCFVGEVELKDGMMFAPGETQRCAWRRAGYVDVAGSFTPEIGKVCEVSAPLSWTPATISVAFASPVDGVKCYMDGVEATGGKMLSPGSYFCMWKRPGYDDIPGRFEVKIGASSQTVSAPDAGEWKPAPQSVTAASAEKSAVCRIAGRELRGGESVVLAPGATYDYEWVLRGYEPQKGSVAVKIGSAATIPAPVPEKWKLLPVAVSVPGNSWGAKCYIATKGEEREVGGSVELMPGSHTSVWKRVDFKDVAKTFSVLPGTPRAIPLPTEGDWVAVEVALTVPSLGNGVSCSIDGVPRRSGESIMLTVGRHTCIFSKPDWQAQTNAFGVARGKSAFPSPASTWQPAPALAALIRAEENEARLSTPGEQADEAQWSQFVAKCDELLDALKASAVLADASHRSRRDALAAKVEKRKSGAAKELDRIKKQATGKKHAAEAWNRYYEQRNADCVVEFSKAVENGYRMTQDDLDAANDAYKSERANLDKMEKSKSRFRNTSAIKTRRDRLDAAYNKLKAK